MPRHSKNATDRSFMTNFELGQSFFNFTQNERIGTDSHLPFGFCCLSMKAPQNAVVTPEGYIYDRDFIIEYMAETKKALLEKKEEYEADQRRKAAQAKLDEAKEQLKYLETFDSTEQGVLDTKTDRIVGRKTFTEINKADFRKKNFWMAYEGADAAPTEKENPIDMTVKCPMSGKRLRIKDLYPVEFKTFNEDAVKKGGESGMFCCEVCSQPITVQQAYYLKPSKKVILETVLQKVIKPGMICPITNKPLKDSDIIKLQKAGTSFCAHNEVAVKRDRLLLSHRQSINERVGSLGKKGTVR